MNMQGVRAVLNEVFNTEVVQARNASNIAISSVPPKEVVLDDFFISKLEHIDKWHFKEMIMEMDKDGEWHIPLNSKVSVLLVSELAFEKYIQPKIFYF